MTPIVKKFTFSKDQREKLQNIEIGLANAEATMSGLSMYKSVFLNDVYRKLGIEEKPKEGFKREIEYNLATGEIVLTQTPDNKDLYAKK